MKVSEILNCMNDEGLNLLAKIESENIEVVKINTIRKDGETFIVEIFLKDVWMDFIAVPRDEFLNKHLSRFFEVEHWEFVYEASNYPTGTMLYLKRLNNN